jgi:nuclear pore complex protein Nup155
LQLFNKYADPGSYYDICLQIFYLADYRNSADIKTTWQHLLQDIHDDTVQRGQALPYETVIEKIRSLGSRLRMSEIIFPIPVLLPMLERYALEFQRGVGPSTWVVDLFLDLEVTHEALYSVLEAMFYNDEAPFQGSNKRFIASDLLYLIQRWYSDTIRLGGTVFGNDAMAARISEMLLLLQQSGIGPELVQLAQELRVMVDNSIR